MSETAAAKRAERRRQKILQNSDDRMKRIFGGQNYHEEHLKVAEMPASDVAISENFTNENFTNGNLTNENFINGNFTNENLAQFVRSIPSGTMGTDSLGMSNSKSPQIVSRGTFWIFWVIFGILIRLILTSKYSWAICDSSLTPYGLIFVFVNFLLPQKNQQGLAGGILDVIGIFAGLDAKKIASFKFTLLIITEFFNTLLSYFAGFLLLDVVLNNM